jgi:hypothetical protein
MNDIHAAMVMIGGACLLFCAIGLKLGELISHFLSTALILGGVTFLVVFAFEWEDKLWIARLLPFTGLPVLGNWLPPAAALVAGLAARHIRGGLLRKSLTLVPLAVVGLASVWWPLFRDPPRCDNIWRGDLCEQTSNATCSPAAAATLLRHHKIAATEEEMARLCLTRQKGTSQHGLYRGLRLKTAGADLDVRVFWGELGVLMDEVRLGPVIASMRLDEDQNADPRYRSEWGWIPGVGHTVVILGLDSDGRAVVADPATVGIETWSHTALRDLWKGEGMRLVKTQ